MLAQLGEALRERRTSQRASLETVARAARISGPYLLKLERGTVSSPSPRVLARVAQALDLPYLSLMEMAGYLDEVDLAAFDRRPPRPHPLADQALSADEWRQVGVFIQDLVARRDPAR
jgi:transcriptional regulator with XRE-family HTH domain